LEKIVAIKMIEGFKVELQVVTDKFIAFRALFVYLFARVILCGNRIELPKESYSDPE
jgi:hypothetical protein